MAQPPANQSCANCSFNIDLSCHFNPPQAWGGNLGVGRPDKGIWPPVTETDWCGQFKPVGPPVAEMKPSPEGVRRPK